MSTGRPRTFPVPRQVRSAHLGERATLDELEFIALLAGGAGEWANRVLGRERARQLDRLCSPTGELPRGLVATGDTHDVVLGLVDKRGRLYRSAAGYEDAPEAVTLVGDLLALDEGEVTHVARALDGQATGVILSSVTPTAWLGRPVVAAALPGVELPEGAKAVAVVDELDKSAVVDLLVVAPGPHVYRRHAGEWVEDEGWVALLRSVRPPPLVAVGAEQLDQIAGQVDESTEGQPFVETSADRLMKASAALLELEERADEIALEFALVGANVGAKVSDVTGQMPAHLQRYWLVGRGAAKIRWGTPGAWRRCYRNLVKYMGPHRAPGACTNLSQKLGGPGVATHVGTKAKSAVKRALT